MEKLLRKAIICQNFSYKEGLGSQNRPVTAADLKPGQNSAREGHSARLVSLVFLPDRHARKGRSPCGANSLSKRAQRKPSQLLPSAPETDRAVGERRVSGPSQERRRKSPQGDNQPQAQQRGDRVGTRSGSRHDHEAGSAPAGDTKGHASRFVRRKSMCLYKEHPKKISTALPVRNIYSPRDTETSLT